VANNNDGIDIDSCHRVRISNCDISSGDDALVLKATSGRACKNVVVTNCILSSDCNAFKLGTESNGGFQNIVMNNCAIYDTRLAAIAVEMVDGGILERVNIDNVVIENAGTAVFMRLGNRARPYLSEGPGGSRGDWVRKPGLMVPGVGQFQRVSISNVKAVGIGNIGCSITGIEEQPVKHVVLENISIQYEGGGTADLVNRKIPELDEKYPEFQMFGQLPSYGFFIRHVKGIRLTGIDLDYERTEMRPAFVFDDVSDLTMSRVNGQLDPNAKAFMVMERVQNALVSGYRPKSPVGVFVAVESSEGISIVNNILTRVEKIVKLGGNMEEEAVFVGFNRH
jgi:hypothetical protein